MMPQEDQFEGFYEEESYYKGLNREDTIEKQTRTVAYFYSKGMWDEFEYSLKALIALLPKMIREDFKPIKHDTTIDDIEKHYQQFLDIQETIETKTNMIFKKRYIKTYE